MASQKQPELFGRVKSLLTLKSDGGVKGDGPSRAKLDPKKKDEKLAADKAKPKKAKAKTNKPKKESTPSKSSAKSDKKKSSDMTEDTKPEKDSQPNQDKIEKRKLDPDPEPEDDLTPIERLVSQYHILQDFDSFLCNPFRISLEAFSLEYEIYGLNISC